MSIKYYEGPYMHRGAGFGGFFKGLLNYVKPVISSPITKQIAKEVFNTGLKIGSDVISGQKPFKESVRTNTVNVRKNLNDVKRKVAKTILESFNDVKPSQQTSEDLGSIDEEGEDGEFVKFGVKNPKKRKNVSLKTSSKKKKSRIIDL